MTLTKNKNILSKPKGKPTSKKQKAVTVKPKKASLAAQRAWAVLTPAQKVKLKKRFNKDPDRDGVPTGFDCQPLNRKKQESFLPDDATYIEKHSSFTPSSKIIGEGTNGFVVPLKDNKNFVVKVGKSGAWSPVNKEGIFFKRHDLSKEPLFIPTKAIKINGRVDGEAKTTGLLRPIVTPIVEPEYTLHRNSTKLLTDAKLKELRLKLIQLSYKGFIFSDGLQLAVDRKGRLLQFDVGAITKYPVSPRFTSSIPFKQNNTEWKRLLSALHKSAKDFGQITRLPEMDKKYQAQRQKIAATKTEAKKAKSESKSTVKAKNQSKATIKAKSQPKPTLNSKMHQGEAKIYIEPKLHFHPQYKTIYQKVQEALKAFPEIKKVYLTAFYPKNKLDKNTIAWVEGENTPGIAFNVHTTPTYNNIYHELWHVIQRMRKSTKVKPHKLKEAEATLFGVGRMKPNQVENNFLTYFNTVPKSKVIQYGKMALKEKEKGNKHYVSTVFQKTEEDKEKEIKTRKSNTKRWEPILKKDFPVKKKFTSVRNRKNFAKGQTPSAVNKYLKTNIRKSQQFGNNLFQIDKQNKHSLYLYSKSDLIKVPNWMKSKPQSSTRSKK